MNERCNKCNDILLYIKKESNFVHVWFCVTCQQYKVQELVGDDRH